MKTISIAKSKQTFTIGLASIAAGAFMGALILAPMSAGADDDDEDNFGPRVQVIEETTPMYLLIDDSGVATEFTLVSNGHGRVLTLVEDANGKSPFTSDADEDDD